MLESEEERVELREMKLKWGVDFVLSGDLLTIECFEDRSLVC